MVIVVHIATQCKLMTGVASQNPNRTRQIEHSSDSYRCQQLDSFLE